MLALIKIFFKKSQINAFQTVFIVLLEDKFSGQRYFGKGVKLWPFVELFFYKKNIS